MEDIDGLKAVKARLAELLSFVNISATEIETLFKTATSKDCESMRMAWRTGDNYVRFDAGLIYDEHSHRKSKAVIVNARTGSTTVQGSIELVEGKFSGFRFELLNQE